MCVSVLLLAACILAAAEGQERADANHPTTRDPASQPWDVPGLKVSEPGMTLFCVSDVCDRWIASDGNLAEAVSLGVPSGLGEAAELYNRGCILRLGGKSAAWRITIYQARSRQDAVDAGKAFIKDTDGAPIPNLVWDGNAMGEMSVGYYWPLTQDKRWFGAVCVRGNVAVAVFSDAPRGPEGRKICDPRPVAASIDSYLRRSPTVDPNADAIPLALEGAVKSDGNMPIAELGKSYIVTGLSSPGMPDANGLLSVSRWQTISDPKMDANRTSEVQVRATNADVTNRLGWGLQVEFKAPGRQRIECWFVNGKGMATAYGRLEVMVVESAHGASTKGGK
jgi:hypothetical protein